MEQITFFRHFDAIKKAATDYTVDWNGGYLYQVTGPYRDWCVINMDKRVCSCRKWELTGISCKHVMAVIYNMSENGMGGLWPVVESRTVIIPPIHKPQEMLQGFKVVQVKLVVLVNKGKEQDKLLVQEMSLVKLLVLVNRVKHQDKLLVQGMPQVKLVVLVNRKKDQDKVLV
ncbi:mutator type transposase [Tanacetum coccineum]